jgi:hypothetical protein
MMRFVLVFLAACSSSTTPPQTQTPRDDAGTVADAGGADSGGGASATVNGTAAGRTIAAKDAVAIISKEEAGGEKKTTAVINIRDAAGVCADLKGGRAVKQSTALTLRVGLGNPHTQPVIAAASYDLAKDGQIEGGNYITVNAKVSKLSDFCQEELAEATRTATAGTITIATISEARVSGSFDLTFGTDKLTGTWDAPLCDVDLSQLPVRPTCR